MAIFSTKNKQKEKPTEAVKTKKKTQLAKTEMDKSVSLARSTDRNLTTVIKKVRSSEKAYYATINDVYVLEVDRSATKHDIRDAVRAVYNVTPRRINIVNQKPRRSLSASRRQSVVVPGLKKAYVYLRPGDKIDLT